MQCTHTYLVNLLQVKVLFVDYGNCEEYWGIDLMSLPEKYRQYPFQVSEFLPAFQSVHIITHMLLFIGHQMLPEGRVK